MSSPVKDPAIVSFQRYDPLIQTGRPDIKLSPNQFTTSQPLLKNFRNNNNSAQFPPIREVGYIEKLLVCIYVWKELQVIVNIRF